MKKIFCLIFFLITFSSYLKAIDTTFVLDGKLNHIKSGLILLIIYNNNEVTKDSTLIRKGKFSFKGVLKERSKATISMPDKNNGEFSFYLEPAKLLIEGDGDSLNLLTLKSSLFDEEDKILKQRMEPVSKWEETNSKLYDEGSKSKNIILLDSLDQVDFNVLNEKRKIVSSFVNDFPHSMRSAMAINENYGYYAEASEVEPLYNLLDDNIKNSLTGIEIKKLIDTYKSVAIGMPAPEIMQLTSRGKSLSLSSLKGKYVLIDFWASWCPPCRRENPNIVKLFNKYKDKGFDIFGVSYDTKKDNWQKAIEDDKLNWNQVSDLNGWKNSTSELYGIKAIPSNFLLDKDGRIIAKNIFGKKLADTLEQLIK